MNIRTKYLQVWKVSLNVVSGKVEPILLSNIKTETQHTNVVRFSPNGTFYNYFIFLLSFFLSMLGQYLASGDSGSLRILLLTFFFFQRSIFIFI